MLSNLVRLQLIAFIGVTVLTVVIMTLNYIKLPSILGFGRDDVQLELAEAGGLYPRAKVSYRGEEVGTVTSIDVRAGGGAVAALSIDDEADIPADAQAQVRSVSALGEQYVDFVPPPAGATRASLTDGSVVPESQTALPTSTGALLTSIDDLVSSVPQDDLRTTVDELGTAFAQSDDDLELLIDSSLALLDAGNENLPQTLALIEDAPKVLATQQDLDPSIRSFATSLDSFTAELRRSDGDLRAVLETGSPLVKEVAALSTKLQPVLPPLLADFATVGEVLRTYLPGLEHIITILPAIAAGTVASTRPDQDLEAAGRKELNLYFKGNVNDPQPCTTGFEDSGKERSPYTDTGPAPIPQDSYCKVAADDPRVVRGARNQPCPNNPARRGATAVMCGLVFDKASVRRTAFLEAEGLGDAGDDMARLIAPHGRLFLVDSSGDAPANSWQKYVEGLIK
ncbi:MlaD family protein [Aeromicrobium sp.]|uniref:MlaD family protein n=1 Tax=Aeromicrobium sp. TaxID=1871063 RepID=UPI0030C2345E